ncbi:energy transducer TonB [Ignatzschineria cameli]|uniref:TonB C-terminal domain-containing protein n=1 Tax=Ignatzschineria cameli TaxID=2182793 RepID=A0A2U2ATN2_9GAMM|nr:energy transducer TonB [Ignatzschineria cameli]PWD88068.1 hypothetical protein DC077_01990 [Ignatzschineria cameli]PWD91099.1 hypothetical protein DC079_02740 [Ignatzschineria cameli]PWD92740.1 hypothetical protein DC081_02740 [Ignatzschineria cameli]PWD93761.1 hypothetical protein DC078_02740 [Ignatzschineria cameli]
MFKFSNIVIFAGVILLHYGILQRLLIAPPDQVVRQDLATAGTILEISLIPEMRMESASSAQSVSNREEISAVEKINVEELSEAAKEISPPEAMTSPFLEEGATFLTTKASKASYYQGDKVEVIKESARKSVGKTVEKPVEKRVKKAVEKPKEVKQTQVKTQKSNIKEERKKPQNSGKRQANRQANNRGDNPQESRSNNRQAGGSDLRNQAFVPPSHQGAALGNRKPRYPELSLRRREEGQVTLLATVLPSGRAKSVKVHKSSGYPRLDEAALKAAKEYRYQPAKRDGQAVEYDYLFTVTFSIEKR